MMHFSTAELTRPNTSSGLARSQPVAWSRYAEVYDLILTYNTAYREIVADFEAMICRWQPTSGQTLLDVGAGTGNFGLRMAERFPKCEVILLDRDAPMLKQAQCKADAMGLHNVRCVQGNVAEVQNLIPDASVAGLVAVHSLYTLPDPLAALHALRAVCQPGARAYLCDVGRVLGLADWAWYLLREITSRHGLMHALRIFWHGRIIGRENRHIAAQQRVGAFWIHSANQFKAAIEAAGFRIEQEREMFRGYSDRVEAIAADAPTSARQLEPSRLRTSHPVRLHAKGRPEGGATLEAAHGQQLTITTADPLYRDIRPGCELRVRLVDSWSEPLVVRKSLKDSQAGVTILTIAISRTASSPFVRRLATELLARGASSGDLKHVGLPVPNLSREVVVRRARADELMQIVQLRTLAYRHDGKHVAPGALIDEFDKRAVQLCAFFCGRPVAALRLMLPTDEDPSEHQRLIQWPADFPVAREVIDISRVCVHPDFRHCRILEALFQRTAAEVLRCGRRWMVGSATDKLLAMYRRIGCIPTRISFKDPKLFGGIAHTVFLSDVRSGLLGRTNPLVWLFVWRKVARTLVQDRVLMPHTRLERLRLSAMLGMARVFEAFAE
jgi:ubiquinone/menaquinone biosynthesis C-methylase UbiE